MRLCTLKLTLILLLCFSIKLVSAQTRQITGTLKDAEGKPVPSASVVLKNNKGFFLSFVYSDIKGEYRISLPDSASIANLFLEVNCFGYKKIHQVFISDKFIYNFVLETQIFDLKEVEVKAKPRIIAIGDTLSYDVASFSRPDDRSIGDVIRRLPGISVAKNGQISYNGKPISNLFIHGDDLMDGRYGLATTAINKDMIKRIDVMQNFQPVKVLKDKVFTEDVAMNLVLKDEHSIKLAGQAMLGAGLPKQYDGALNAMLFNKEIKMLNSLKANNSGIDLKNDFAQLGMPTLSNDAGNSRPSNMLNFGTVGNPDLPRMNYYLNNSQLLNTNNLLNLSNSLQIKSNVQVFFDQNNLNYANKLSTYLNGDTINYNELQGVNNKPFAINTSLSATVNKNTYFLTNKLSLNFDKNNANSFLNFNNQYFEQRLKEHKMSFINDFSYIPAMKNSKNVLDLRWYISSFNNPQQLTIDTGLNAIQLNQGMPYAGIIQDVAIPTFLNNMSVAYKIFNDRLIQQNYLISVNNERQELNSKLNLIQLNHDALPYSGDVGNALTWQRDRLTANATYTIQKKGFNASFALPVTAQFIRYKQSFYELNERSNDLLINPNANLRVNLNAEDYISLNYQFANNFGGINTIYNGAVLANYRTILANQAELREIKVANLTSMYHFRRSIIMLFFGAQIDYKKATSNTIVASELSDNIQRIVLRQFLNDQSTLNFNFNISKYVFAIHTTASLNTSIGKSNYNQLINNKLYPFTNKALTLVGKLESKLFGKLTLSYTGQGFWNYSKQKTQEGIDFNLSNRSKRLDQALNVGYSPLNDLFINLTAKHIYGQQANISPINYTFLDINTRYKIKRWRTDVELNVSNLANINNYEVFSLTANQFFVSNYKIRGRMAILRATFNL